MLLLLLLSLALSVGAAFTVLAVRRGRRESRSAAPNPPPDLPCPGGRACFLRPACWLAIKTRNLWAVQSALGLHNPKPCSWLEGLADDDKLFIAPPVKGWILVMGSGLPDPSDDVDACFRFIVTVSRKLGEVQFFSASRVLFNHAWVHVDSGKILRAYAWAGKTLWKQGRRTPAEKELDLKCFDYSELVDRPPFGQPEAIATNVDKVPLLAARWSLDPARIDERFIEKEHGIAGEPPRRF